jgi:hypothetical protein
MLGPGIISASVPVTVGYSIHALRKSKDKGWAVLALIPGTLMSLLVLWVLVMIVADIITR